MPFTLLCRWNCFYCNEYWIKIDEKYFILAHSLIDSCTHFKALLFASAAMQHHVCWSKAAPSQLEGKERNRKMKEGVTQNSIQRHSFKVLDSSSRPCILKVPSLSKSLWSVESYYYVYHSSMKDSVTEVTSDRQTLLGKSLTKQLNDLPSELNTF